MNCVDLQRSLAEVEELSTAGQKTAQIVAQQAHLKACAACATLVAELDLIASSASELRATEEPSPRVWNAIEIALRQEGLIRPQTNRPFVVPQPVVLQPVASRAVSSRSLSSFAAGWGWRGWLVPAAAALLIAVGIFVNQRSLSHRLAKNVVPAAATVRAVDATVAGLNVAGLNDDDLLQEIQNQTPAMRAQYVDNLRSANEYISDAQSTVDANPNDEESRRSLLEAYQQKAMLFEMAMDRSLP
jgi:hypothetical protein